MVSNKTAVVQTFVSEQFGEIRTAGTWDNPLFCLADVCRALELGNPSQVKKRLEKGVISNETLQTAGGMQKLTFINEDGLYDVIFDSRKPEAKAFRKWVTHEVLPSIRKTGSYSIVETNDDRWAETRAHGKKSRKKETQVIKLFIEYARSQGCTWKDKKFYSQLSIWANDAAGIKLKNGRDEASVQALNIIDLIEDRLIQDEMLNGMANQLHYTEIWAKIQLRIKAFVAITHQTSPLLNGT